MGMSAPQVNLLSLTARLHDIEYKAQNIMSEKVALATQQDEVYQNYLRALDAKKVQVAFCDGVGGKQFLDATFTNVCTYNESRYQNYSLKDMRTGKLFVTDDMYKAYNRSSDKYNFAWDMLNLVEDSGANWDRNVSVPEGLPDNTVPELTDAEFLTLMDNIGQSIIDENWNSRDTNDYVIGFVRYAKEGDAYLDELLEMYKTGVSKDGVEVTAETKAKIEKRLKEDYLFTDNIDWNSENTFAAFKDYMLSSMKNGIKEFLKSQGADYNNDLRILYLDYLQSNDTKSKAEIAHNIKQTLYTNYIEQIYNYMRVPKTQADYYKPEDAELFGDKLYGSDEFPEKEFNYYVQMWENINASGGCIVVPASANAGDEANKWFNDMVSSGKAIICTYNETTKGWDEQTVANTISGNYLIENQDDKDLKKAEAEYEYNLNIIKKKDSEFDKSLSKLETEKSSIEQMMESINTAIHESIERTFNLFN